MIEKILDILEKAKEEVSIIKDMDKKNSYYEKEQFVDEEGKTDCNLFYGDNLDVMSFLLDKKEQLDLIYIDPPFASKANYSTKIKLKNKDDEIVKFNSLVYRDNWKEDIIGYLEMLTPRLMLMRELLSDRGSIYIHVDWHASHYVKIILDEIFGRDNFINEIIWNYKSGGASKKRFSRKHDTIFLYAKTNDYIFNSKKEKSYNRGYKKYGFKGVEEYVDDIGWYTLVNMKDTWEIDMVGRTSKERVEYATQKPIKLLKRIIEISSNKDSIVGDFFSGSGTTVAVASELGRKCISVDSCKKSVSTIQKRLIDNDISYRYFEDKKNSKNNNFSVVCKIENGKVNVNNIKYKDVDKLPIKKKEREEFLKLVSINKDVVIDYILECVYINNIIRIYRALDNQESKEDNDDETMIYEVIYKIVDIFGNYMYVKNPLA